MYLSVFGSKRRIENEKSKTHQSAALNHDSILSSQIALNNILKKEKTKQLLRSGKKGENVLDLKGDSENGSGEATDTFLRHSAVKDSDQSNEHLNAGNNFSNLVSGYFDESVDKDFRGAYLFEKNKENCSDSVDIFEESAKDAIKPTWYNVKLSNLNMSQYTDDQELMNSCKSLAKGDLDVANLIFDYEKTVRMHMDTKKSKDQEIQNLILQNDALKAESDNLQTDGQLLKKQILDLELQCEQLRLLYKKNLTQQAVPTDFVCQSLFDMGKKIDQDSNIDFDKIQLRSSKFLSQKSLEDQIKRLTQRNQLLEKQMLDHRQLYSNKIKLMQDHVARSKTHMLGAMRKIQWLVAEKDKLESKNKEITGYVIKLESKILQLSRMPEIKNEPRAKESKRSDSATSSSQTHANISLTIPSVKSSLRSGANHPFDSSKSIHRFSTRFEKDFFSVSESLKNLEQYLVDADKYLTENSVEQSYSPIDFGDFGNFTPLSSISSPK